LAEAVRGSSNGGATPQEFSSCSQGQLLLRASGQVLRQDRPRAKSPNGESFIVARIVRLGQFQTPFCSLVKSIQFMMPAVHDISVGGGRSKCETAPASMLKVKDTLRATVNLTFDGRVIKVYHGPNAQARFDNEVAVLRFLEARHCPFVPRLVEANPEQLKIITTNCGSRVEHLDETRRKEIFAELERFGVRHDDADQRNVTYRSSDGRFCVIDFEFATILPGFAQS
jgi:hypothetical protein